MGGQGRGRAGHHGLWQGLTSSQLRLELALCALRLFGTHRTGRGGSGEGLEWWGPGGGGTNALEMVFRWEVVRWGNQGEHAIEN